MKTTIFFVVMFVAGVAGLITDCAQRKTAIATTPHIETSPEVIESQRENAAARNYLALLRADLQIRSNDFLIGAAIGAAIGRSEKVFSSWDEFAATAWLIRSNGVTGYERFLK